MNVVHVSETDLVGGRFNGYSMQQGVDPAECTFGMAVWSKKSDNPAVHALRPPRAGILRKPRAVLQLMDRGFGLEGLTGLGSLAYPLRSFFRQADVVHLQLLHNGAYFSILALPLLARAKPIVWTIHDSWAFTGMCVYPFDCERWLTGCRGRCPHPRGRGITRQWIPAVHWWVKRATYRHSPLSLVVASEFMRERVARSPLLGHLPCHLIPFGVDLQLFSPRPRAEARAALGLVGLREGEHVLAFRGNPPKVDQYKGIAWLREALELYEPPVPTTLLIMQDASGFWPLSKKYRIVDLGWADGEVLANALSAADLFLMPSVQEAFGLMAVEAMACGTPVVVFEGTSLPEVIGAPDGGGTVVPMKDSRALASEIARLLADDETREALGRRAREIAEREYAHSLYVRRHLDLYRSLLESAQ